MNEHRGYSELTKSSPKNQMPCDLTQRCTGKKKKGMPNGDYEEVAQAGQGTCHSCVQCDDCSP